MNEPSESLYARQGYCICFIGGIIKTKNLFRSEIFTGFKLSCFHFASGEAWSAVICCSVYFVF